MSSRTGASRISSSERVNYALRPNKHVERSLIFRALDRLEPDFGVSKYRYLGLGGLWFVDFLMAHRMLGIREMMSIEGKLFARAQANRPLACITVVDGTTSAVLPKQNLGDKRMIAWLDYDGPVTAAILEDLRKLVKGVTNGSIVLVTVNANPPRQDKAAIEQVLGDLLVEPLSAEQMKDGSKGFGGTLANALIAHLQAEAMVRSSGRFIPLFNFFYADGASMITVGGMIGGTEEKDAVGRSGIESYPGVGGVKQFVVDVPLLTIREKLIIDRCLPAEKLATAEMKELGIHLSATQLEEYVKLYSYYPMFAEILP